MSVDPNSVLSAYKTIGGAKDQLKTLDTYINLDALKDVTVDDAAGPKSKLSKVRKMDPYFEHINISSKY